MQSIWQINTFTEEQQALRDRLAAELQISSLSAGLLISRGLTTAEQARSFIRPQLSGLHDPFLMKDMTEAEARLSEAIAGKQRILIYGDYDVDGTTAVSLVFSFLRQFTDAIDFYIPDRYSEGYGISFQGIDYALSTGCQLIIALDCGIKSVDKVAYAAARGIDFIICDHHKPGEELPAAAAVLNPHREDCSYPYTELSGCGVGFKLMQAYAMQHNIQIDSLRALLPLLAMSIASDIVPITGENRILAHFGLLQINKCPSLGLRTIMSLAGLQPGRITISDLVYKIGPRVNACGRIRSGADAVRLLTTDDPNQAEELAQAVEDNNNERKGLDKTIYEEAMLQLREDPLTEQRNATVVFAPHWHKGVVGIVASRLTENFYRPTIVLTQGDDGLISGSARSVSDFDIYSAIDSCRDLLTNFGGHDFAAGLSMYPENLPAFKERFEQYVSDHILPHQKEPVIHVDAEILLADITPQFFRILQCLEPYGPGNPRPIFITRNLINYRYTKRVGKQGEHLKLNVTDRSINAAGSPVFIDGIAFHQGDFAPLLQNGQAVDVCYRLEENCYNGHVSIQMQVEEIKQR